MLKFEEGKKNVADAVYISLKILIADSVSLNGAVAVSPYFNGREQGYHLNIYSNEGGCIAEFSFSEHRNSDAIVVYYGDGKERFDVWNGVPTDDAYEKAQYFNDISSASKFIADKVRAAFGQI